MVTYINPNTVPLEVKVIASRNIETQELIAALEKSQQNPRILEAIVEQVEFINKQ